MFAFPVCSLQVWIIIARLNNHLPVWSINNINEQIHSVMFCSGCCFMHLFVMHAWQHMFQSQHEWYVRWYYNCVLFSRFAFALAWWWVWRGGHVQTSGLHATHCMCHFPEFWKMAQEQVQSVDFCMGRKAWGFMKCKIFMLKSALIFFPKAENRFNPKLSWTLALRCRGHKQLQYPTLDYIRRCTINPLTGYLIHLSSTKVELHRQGNL